MIDSAFAPLKSGVGSGYSSAKPVDGVDDKPVASADTKTADSVDSDLKTSAPPLKIVSASSSNPNNHQIPKKKSPKIKSRTKPILFFSIICLLLIGGLTSAYFLAQRSQDIRQQAEEEVAPQSFSLQSQGVAKLIFVPDGDGPLPSIEAQLTFSENPKCGVDTSCAAQTKFEVLSQLMPEVGVCELREASVTSYNFLTNVNDPNYPKNLSNADPAADIISNCNRSLDECANDPNCSITENKSLTQPVNCENGCSTLEGSLSFSVTDLEYRCGCVQFVIDVPKLSIACQSELGGEMVEYSYVRNNQGEISGPWAYGFNDNQCLVAQPTSTIAPTTTPTTDPTLPTQTLTPLPTQPVLIGEMCVSISSSPVSPKFNDMVTLTCGTVSGAGSYEFRYFPPNSSTPRSIAASSTANISQPFQVTQAGKYTAQCRVCPVVTTANQYCNDPNWGWGAIIAPPPSAEE